MAAPFLWPPKTHEQLFVSGACRAEIGVYLMHEVKLPILLFLLISAVSLPLTGYAECSTATAPVNVQNATFASGTGISSNPGLSCKGVAGNASGLADPTGENDSTCAVRNAAVYAASCNESGEYPPLYFPTGHYSFNISGTSGVIVLTNPIGVTGDGATASLLQNKSPNAALLTYVGVTGPSVMNVGLAGNGPATNGDLIDVISSVGGTYQNLALSNTAGIGINLQGSSERGRFGNISMNGVRLALNSEGNTNENYVENFDFSFNGFSAFNGNPGNQWNYDSNANPYTGIEITADCVSLSPAAWSSSTSYSGTAAVSYGGATYNLVTANSGQTPQLISRYWQQCGQSPKPEERALVYLDGENWMLSNGSIKATLLSGVNVARTTAQVSHVYFEGPFGPKAPNYSYSTQVIGKQEVGHLTAAVSSSSLVFPVDDAGWQHEYTTDPSLLHHLVTDNKVAIFPSDYLAGSSAQSTAVPGMLRGQYEIVVIAYSGDNPIYPGAGTGHATARAITGSVAPGIVCSSTQMDKCGPGPMNAAVSYPAPASVNGVLTASALIAQLPDAGYGVSEIQENHFNMAKVNSATTVGVCSDTGILPPNGQWIGSPSLMCAENFAGAVPDGITLQIPQSPGYVSVGANVDYVNNTTLGSSLPEAQGFGWIKIGSNAAVHIDQGDGELYAIPSLPQAYISYVNGTTSVQFVDWGGTSGNAVTASGTITDASAQVAITNLGSLQNAFNSYSAVDATVPGSAGPATVAIDNSSNCTYLAQNNASGKPTLRTCIDPDTGLLSTQVLFSGNWINAPGTAHVFTAAAGTTGTATLPAAPAGTVPGDGVYRASCSSNSGGVYINGGAYGGFQNPNTNSTTTLSFSPGLPPGIVYGLGQFGAGPDPTNGVFGNYISITLCNTTSASIKLPNSSITITQTH